MQTGSVFVTVTLTCSNVLNNFRLSIKPLQGRIPPFLPFPSIHSPPPSHQSNFLFFLDHEYISQIKLDPHETFREASCGCPMLMKTKNPDKQKNKQANKHIDPKYRNQIM